jgi:hypothetical protein
MKTLKDVMPWSTQSPISAITLGWASVIAMWNP